MSQANVEVVRGFLEAYNGRDFDRIIELMDPSFEFRSRFVGLESVGHQGRDVHRASGGVRSRGPVGLTVCSEPLALRIQSVAFRVAEATTKRPSR